MAPNPVFWRRALLLTPPAAYLFASLFPFGRVDGRSMQPHLNPDTNQLTRDVVFINYWKRPTDYQHGDVVNLIAPHNPHLLLTKRIIGLPGDLVLPNPSTGNPLHGSSDPPHPVFIPKGHCWVEGDESFHSTDSNQFGPIPLGLVQGQVRYVVWPPANFGPVRSDLPPWKRKRVL
ncbi:hypothetical protein IWQ61_005924 [Dispira simplex]|nr:hypothetical protein IWQ61_005924 [Dispira simplex]